MSPTSRSTPRIDLCLELLLIALLIFLPAALGTVDAWSELVAMIVAGVMAALLTARYAIRREHIFCSLIIAVPIGLFVALVLFQLIPLPLGVVHLLAPQSFELKSQLLGDLPDATSALSRMTVAFYAPATRHDLRIVLFAISILATTLAITRDDRRQLRLLGAVSLIGIAAAVLALAQDLTHTMSIYWSIPLGELARNGPFANHSHYGQFMNLSIGASIALLLTLVTPTLGETDRSRWRWFAAAAIAGGIVLGWATIALSLTRGGVIAGAVAGCFAILTLLTFRRGRLLGVMIGVLALTAVGLLLHFGPDQVVARMQTQSLMAERSQMNSDSWEMAKQHSFIGAGLGNYEWVFPMFDRALSTSKAAYADNDYLQTLAETGWAGIAMVAAFLFVVWWNWLCAIRRGDTPTSLTAIGLGYGLVAVMIHGCSDFGQHLPANACLSAITCGMLLNLGRSGDRQTESRTDLFKVVVAAVIVISATAWTIVGATRSWRGDTHWTEARHIARQLEREDWTDATDIAALREQTDAAIAAETDNAYYLYRSAVYAWRIAVHQFDHGSPELLAAAKNVIAQLNTARALCPTYGPIYLIMGQIEYAHLGLSTGIEHLHTATRLQQNDPTIWFAAAKVDMQRGDIATAQSEFRRALNLDFNTISDIAEFYLDDLKQPQLLIDLADNNCFRLYSIGKLLMERPAYFNLGGATYRHAIELHIEETRRDPTLGNLAAAGEGAFEIQRDDVAQEFFGAALKQDPSQIAMRARRAQALIRLGRLDEASQELDVIRRQNPQEPQLAEIGKQLEAARAKQ